MDPVEDIASDDEAKESFAKVRPLNVHTYFQSFSIEETQSIGKALSIPCRVLTWNVQYNLNVGTMVRTAACFGFEEIYVVSRCRIDRRAMVGAHHYLRFTRIKGEIEDPVAFFEREKIFPILIEQGGIDLKRAPLRSYFDQTNADGESLTPCLIFGNEGSGIPQHVLDACETYPRISLSQLGMIRSLNVGVCAGIVMYEMQEAYRSRSPLME